jgi:hypothetical protein
LSTADFDGILDIFVEGIDLNNYEAPSSWTT